MGSGCEGGRETAGGCECPEGDGADTARISLACYQQEFPDRPSSYEEAVAHAAFYCESGVPAVEVVGCGRRQLRMLGGFTSETYTYDANRVLLAASNASDVGHGACGAFVYEAGPAFNCSEGTICSLCESGAASCRPCSEDTDPC